MEIKLTVSTETQAVENMFCELPEETKERILQLYVFEDIVLAIENQLRRNTDLTSWSTDGWRDGSKIRAAILATQGIEPEFKADLESQIRSLESNVKYYKKYYDWYFKLYHLEDRELSARVMKMLPSPN